MTDIKSVYEEKPFIKLSKMSKGYQWEIKIIGDTKEDVEHLAKLDMELNLRYGQESL